MWTSLWYKTNRTPENKIEGSQVVWHRVPDGPRGSSKGMWNSEAGPHELYRRSENMQELPLCETKKKNANLDATVLMN